MRELTFVKKINMKKIFQFSSKDEFIKGDWLKDKISPDKKLEMSYNPENLILTINVLEELDVKKTKKSETEEK